MLDKALKLRIFIFGPRTLNCKKVTEGIAQWDETQRATFFSPPATSLKNRFLQSLLLLPGMAFAISLQSMDFVSPPERVTRHQWHVRDV